MTHRNKCFVIVICLVVFLAGYLVGQFRPLRLHEPWKGPMVSEFKVLHANLQTPDLTPQLREFLKSRLYYVASSLNPSDVDGYTFDYGPIDEQVLGKAQGNKGPESQAELYQLAMARHPAAKKKIE